MIGDFLGMFLQSNLDIFLLNSVFKPRGTPIAHIDNTGASSRFEERNETIKFPFERIRHFNLESKTREDQYGRSGCRNRE